MAHGSREPGRGQRAAPPTPINCIRYWLLSKNSDSHLCISPATPLGDTRAEKQFGRESSQAYKYQEQGPDEVTTSVKKTQTAASKRTTQRRRNQPRYSDLFSQLAQANNCVIRACFVSLLCVRCPRQRSTRKFIYDDPAHVHR